MSSRPMSLSGVLVATRVGDRDLGHGAAPWPAGARVLASLGRVRCSDPWQTAVDTKRRYWAVMQSPRFQSHSYVCTRNAGLRGSRSHQTRALLRAQDQREPRRGPSITYRTRLGRHLSRAAISSYLGVALGYFTRRLSLRSRILARSAGETAFASFTLSRACTRFNWSVSTGFTTVSAFASPIAFPASNASCMQRITAARSACSDCARCITASVKTCSARLARSITLLVYSV